MSIESRVPQYGTLFDRWEIREEISPGQFRLVSGSEADCILKVISLIEEPGTLSALTPEQQEDYSLRRRQRRKEMEKRLLTIVGTGECLEYTFLDWEDVDGYGRDLLVRARMPALPQEEEDVCEPFEPIPESPYTVSSDEPELPLEEVSADEPAAEEEEEDVPASNIYTTVIRILIGVIAVAILFVAFIFGKIVLELKAQVDQAALQPTVPAATVEEMPTETTATEAPTEVPTEPTAVLDPTKIVSLSIGQCHAAAAYEDGSVDVVYLNEAMRRKYPAWDVWDASSVAQWTGITQVSVSRYHMAGLKSDGTVVALGGNDYGECNTAEWTDIVAIATGEHTTVGLKSDGTLVSAGSTIKIGSVAYIEDVKAIDLGSGCLEFLQNDGSWKRRLGDGSEQTLGVYPELVKIYSNDTDSIGILSDGTVVVGRTSRLNKTKLAEWTDIVDIHGNASCLLGLKSDGTVRVMGTDNQHNQQNVVHWTGIEKLVGPSMGLKSDGTLVLAGTSVLQSFDLGPLNKAPSVSDGQPGRVYRSSTGVNVRSYPGINCDVVTRLPMDTSVIILEQKATYDGTMWGRTWYGWISMDFVELLEPAEETVPATE